MALPSSGSITAAQINAELGRGASAPFSMNGDEERALAGKPSGSISFSDFHGKASEIVKTLLAGTTPITLESLFTSAEWSSTTAKRVILPSGSDRGNTSTLAPAVTVGTNGWGGQLTFDVAGTISGKGGTSNSGIGGDALDVNRVGLSGQKLIVNLSGTLRAGGGGGGKGGNGGNGMSSVREPASGESYASGSYEFLYLVFSEIWTVTWNGTSVASGDGNPPASAVGTDGRTYWRGSIRSTGSTATRYGVYRTLDSPVTGGVGGDGGRGQGADGNRASGSPGVTGSGNAGSGGTGGAGGLYGAQGSTGSPGTNGSTTSGTSGTAGGLAGVALGHAANAIVNNSGAIVGRTT